MSFLIDENLSPKICSRLIAVGHEAHHVREVGLAGAPDFQVLARAAQDGSVLVTADRGDFGKELAGTGATRPDAGAFVVLTSRAIRVRYLPLR